MHSLEIIDLNDEEIYTRDTSKNENHFDASDAGNQ